MRGRNRKGYWLNRGYREKRGTYCVECSECGSMIFFGKPIDEEPINFVYCPYCGKRMGGVWCDK